MSFLTPDRIKRFYQSRFNPIRFLTPALLAERLDAFEAGYLREAALAFDLIERRDDMVKSVAAKRKKAVARHGYEIITLPNLAPELQAEAQKQKQALDHFYRHLACVNALDENEQGGFKLLVRQMMDAVGKRYAVHEIVWRPQPAASPGAPPRLTAEFRFVPLWFFENTTGRLRFLPEDHSLQGRGLEEGSWMITVGEGLMSACSVAWMFKHLPLQDWLDYCQKYGRPAVRASTSAARNTAAWKDMEQALGDFLTDLQVVTTKDETFDVISLKGPGGAPFEELIARMDRLIGALWRGADLSTLSREQGYGASLQAGETDILEEDDAEMISETLHRYVDRPVIRYLFGGAPPLACVKILVTPKQCTDHDLKVDTFLIEHGARLSVSDALARYGRAPADEAEPSLTRPSAAAEPPPRQEAA